MLPPDLIKKITKNAVVELSKSDLTMSEKWLLVNEEMKERNLSYNEARKELNIGVTTLHTWRRAFELGEDNHKQLLKNGWSETDIQNSLKNGSALTLKEKVEKKRIDVLLEETRIKLSEYIHNKDFSNETATKIRELQNVLNRILMRVEK